MIRILKPPKVTSISDDVTMFACIIFENLVYCNFSGFFVEVGFKNTVKFNPMGFKTPFFRRELYQEKLYPKDLWSRYLSKNQIVFTWPLKLFFEEASLRNLRDLSLAGNQLKIVPEQINVAMPCFLAGKGCWHEEDAQNQSKPPTLPSLKPETNIDPWKMGVGRLVSFWERLFSLCYFQILSASV